MTQLPSGARLFVLVMWNIPREATKMYGPFPTRDAAQHAHVTYARHAWKSPNCRCSVQPVETPSAIRGTQKPAEATS